MKKAKDRQDERAIISRFIEIYCQRQHGSKKRSLCISCQDLHDYALKRLEKCPYDPKPKCKHCPTHCYRGDYRDKIREVMKFSGIYYVKKGRIDWLFKYFMR